MRSVARASLLRVSFLLAISCSPLAAQSPGSTASQSPVRDPQAVALASRALAILTGTSAVRDVTLAGSVTRVAGADEESGTVTLKALGSSESRMDLSLSDEQRSEVRTSAEGSPQGLWFAGSGPSTAMAAHNCLTDAAWFFPAFSVLSQLSNPSLVAKYVGEETRGQEAVQHLRFFLIISDASVDPSGLYSRLTEEDIYLDASSLLPVALAFSTHPDNNALIDIPVEVDFSNYQTVSGAPVPFRIQKFRNGTLFLDITVQSADLNSGLTDSVFSSN